MLFRSTVTAALLLVSAGVHASVSASDALSAAPGLLGQSTRPRNVVPRGYIVEFADDAEQHIARQAKRSLESVSVHAEFHQFMTRSIAALDKGEETLQQVRKRGLFDALSSILSSILGTGNNGGPGSDAASLYSQRQSFDEAGLFRGVSVLLSSERYAGLLSKAPGVTRVSPIRIFERPDFDPVGVPQEIVGNILGASAVPPPPGRRDDQSIDAYAPHRMTGVDRLHAEGFLGQNTTIGILDTGIDYTHPALNGGRPSGTACYGQPECQVIGGGNYASDGKPDDPFDPCEGHGTHVASIAAGRTSAGQNFTGVAPEAKIRAYRIFGCDGDLDEDVFIKALTQAHTDGNDVINMSLGAAEGWPDDPSSVVATRIVAKGTAFVIAASNDGAEGSFYGANPAAARNTTSVGSVENIDLVTHSIYAEGTSDGEREFPLLTLNPWNVTQGKLPLKIINPSLDADSEGCDPAEVKAAGPFDNAVVLVARSPRSGCKITVKLQNILANGGKYVLVYGKPLPSGLIYSRSSLEGQLASTVLRTDGLYLKQQVASGKPVQIDFSRQVLSVTENSLNGGRMSDYSSMTPYWTIGEGGPSVSAPGGNIIGAFPLSEWLHASAEPCPYTDVALIVELDKTGWVVLSGTSQASPYGAGGEALLKSALRKMNAGDVDPVKIRDRLTITATPVKVTNSDGSPPTTLDTVVKQGGGLVNLYRAVHSKTGIEPAALYLNDAARAKLQQTIQITNKNAAAQTYAISHMAAGTVLSINRTNNFWNPFPVPTDPRAATVSISPSTVSVAPGQTATVKLSFAPPSLDAAYIPVFSGWISITSAEEKDLGSTVVPYFGIGADMSKEEVFDLGTSALGMAAPVLVDASGTPIKDDRAVFTLASGVGYTDAPSIIARFRLGTRRVTVDLVVHNTTFQPTLPIPGSPAQEALHRRAIHHRVLDSAKRRRSWPLRSNKRDSVAFDDVPILGRLVDSPLNPRDTLDGFWFTIGLDSPLMAPNGAGNITVRDGNYRFLLRASKLLADDLEQEDSYESYLTHAFKIKR